ncbi:histone-lysine N-methyltransferase SETD1B [Xyrauchen texanus]|uniref:histone-lysine N-methyltransferase SETD1B n=1 Tax=Xyrauchen texanus TaxID=154827 RepID=UPI00224216CA|nr:histone-lysine N-methyltransferase SETD1B [Xyrauchen texanus]
MYESVEKEAQLKDKEAFINNDHFDEPTTNWSCYKLIIDPALNSGTQKLYRYDGQLFSSPHPECFPVDIVRDPRITRFWAKFKEADLPVPKFMVDENYVGAPKELTFARLNDNIRDGFLFEMCKHFGEIQDLKVLYSPKNKKHLGIAKVIFESAKAANNAVQNLHNTSVMGNNIHVEYDPKGVKRKRYLQMLVSGLYTPFTLPVGEETCGPQSPASTYSFSDCVPLKKLSLSSSSSLYNGSPSLDCCTPLSMDTAYSSMHQDTPNSFWQTPQYQDTPCTPSLSNSIPGTPSQCERIPNESVKIANTSNTPFNQQSIQNISQLQASQLNLLLAQPSSDKPSIIQGTAQNFCMQHGAVSQNGGFSNRQRTSGRNSHLHSSRFLGKHQSRPLGNKYQNAYNRRPEHHYIHRPVYRGSHYRSGPQGSFNNFQDFPSTQSHSDKLRFFTQCTSDNNKPAIILGKNITGSLKGLSVNPRSVFEEPPSLPILETMHVKAIGGDNHCFHPVIEIKANASENSGIPSQESCKTTQEVNQNRCLHDSPKDHPSCSNTPKQCLSSETTQDFSDPIMQCPSPASPTPDPKPDSLDSRIQKLLSAGNSILPLLSQESSDSETATEDQDTDSISHPLPSPKAPSPTPSSSTYVALNCVQTPFSANNTGSHSGESFSASGIEDVSSTPLLYLAEEERELQSAKKSSSKIFSSTSVIPTSSEDENTSDEPFRIPVICSNRGSLPPPISQIPLPPILTPPPAHFLSYQPSIIPTKLEPPPPVAPLLPGYALSGASSCSLYPPPKIKQNCRPPNWQSSPVPLPIPTRITQGQPSISLPFFAPPGCPPPFSYITHRPPYPSAGCSSTMLRYRPPWPPSLMPRFDPSVPPPGYVPMKEFLHNATVDGVLAVVAAELRAIVKKDIHRRIIEVVAFKAFDQWWDDKEQEAKVPAPLKLGGNKDPKLRIMEECLKMRTARGEGTVLCTGKIMSLHGAIKLPSFKRNDPLDEASTDVKIICSSPSPEHSEDEEPEQQTAPEIDGEDKTKKTSKNSMVKCRHSRPLVLESDEEDEDTEKVEDPKYEEVQEVHKKKVNEENKDKESNPRLIREDEDYDDADVVSNTSLDSSASQSQGYDSLVSSRTVFDSSASSPSVTGSPASSRSFFDSSDDRSVESSDSLSSGEDDQLDEESTESPDEERSMVEEIWISSDEDDNEKREMMHTPVHSSFVHWEEDLEPPVTPSAPVLVESDADHMLLDLDPEDPEEELSVRVYMQGLKLSDPLKYTLQDPVKHCLTNKLKLTDPVTFFSDQEPELPSAPSPSYRALSDDLETQYTTDSEDQQIITETLEDSENLRPITPTGSLSDSDPEMELRFSPPVLEMVELPHTPGGCLELEEAEEHVLPPGPPTPLPPPPSPTGHQELPCSTLYQCPPFPFSYPAYEETPKTPGRVNGSGHIYDSEVIGSLLSPSNPLLSSCADSGIPRTPGRDLSPSSPVLNHREINFQERDLLHPHNSGFAQSHSQTDNLGIDNGHLHSDHRRIAHLDKAHFKRRRERLKMKRRMIEFQRNRNSMNTHPSAHQVLGPLDHVSDIRTEHMLPEDQKKMPLQESSCLWRRWGESLPQSSTHYLIFPPRSERQEKLVLHAVWTKGVNEEEIGHLKSTYEKLLLEDNECEWLSSTRWIPHPPTSSHDERPRRWLEGIRDHMTGCARTEGYYFISKRDKLRYLRYTHLNSEELTEDTQGKSVPAQVPPSSRSGSELRAEQRRLLSSFSCDSDLLKFNQLKFRKKKLRFGRSHIHDWGLFAEEPIAAEEMIIEYVGQSIRQVIADMRERRYENEGIGSSYLFRVDQDTIIDATKFGNLARFINHSCNPNCYAKVITVESQKKIVIYSRQPIGVNEEITYDYKFPIEDEKIPCLCAAENCRGTLN